MRKGEDCNLFVPGAGLVLRAAFGTFEGFFLASLRVFWWV